MTTHVKCVQVKHIHFILHCFYKQFLNNSCNKILFTENPLYFKLQQIILKNIIKSDLKFT